MAWYGDRKKHSMCARGYKTGRKHYLHMKRRTRRVLYHRYDPALDKGDKKVFRSARRCPYCGTGLSAQGSEWYCINCNKYLDFTDPSLRREVNAIEKERQHLLTRGEQPLRDADWILHNMKKNEKNADELHKWEKKWENWCAAYPELKDLALKKNTRRPPSVWVYDRRTRRHIHKRHVSRRYGYTILS